MSLRLGIKTPVLSWKLDAPDWIQRGTIDDVAQVVAEADGLGYDFCTCAEHIGLPLTEMERRGRAYWDPLASLSYLAATTSQIRLVTRVLVLGYHHPVEVAKRYGQLDLMSKGRLVLGVGVGTLKDEFVLIGADFEGRGDRADDAIRAIKAIWGRDWAAYHGSHYDFSDWWVVPHAPRTEVPVWVGGRTRRSVRRAVELGEGWMPFGLDLAQIGELLQWGKSLPTWKDRAGKSFDILVTSPELPDLDPLGDRDGIVARLREVHDAGVTLWGTGLVSRSKQHYLEQLAALSEIAASTLEWPGPRRSAADAPA
jgi:probable F420-dependent oxidoreductase